MSRRVSVIMLFLVAAWWSMTGVPATAQTWGEILGALAGAEEQPAEEVTSAESSEEEPVNAVEPQPVDSVEAGFALKEALLIAAEDAVAKGSKVDGFLADSSIRVPLPAKLEFARETLIRFGLDREVDDLDLAMNRAAEKTAAVALPYLKDAIRDVLIEDPLATLGAGGSAAADTLRARAGPTLLERLTPTVEVEMEQTGVAAAYDRLAKKGGHLVTQAGVTSEDLTPHVAGRTLDGLFTLIAAQESAIRADPAARTSPLLARVFGSTQSAPTESSQQAEGQPKGDDTQQALKQALAIGARKAVERASQTDGFFGNSKIRVPMPEAIDKVGQSLRSFGMGQVVDDFELSMNRAAEKAAAEATPILVDAVKNVSFGDALSILNGGDTAATDALREMTTDSLTAVFQPIVTAKMKETGVTRSYEQLMESGGSFMALLGGDSQQDLPAYVTDKALDGLFVLVAEEEAKIREDPVARTTDLLTRVFGSLGG